MNICMLHEWQKYGQHIPFSKHKHDVKDIPTVVSTVEAVATTSKGYHCSGIFVDFVIGAKTNIYVCNIFL